MFPLHHQRGEIPSNWCVLQSMRLVRVIMIVLSHLLFVFVVCGFAQDSLAPKPAQPKPVCNNELRSTYLLGPDDELVISGPEITEFGNKPVRIDSDGNVQAPLVGRIHVAGITLQQAEQELNKDLSKYIREPQVVVSIAEVRSQPVSVLGAVNTPGVHQV